jgi:hypothetical protein
LLDDTPLPPALSALNGIEMRSLEAALRKILQALHRPVASTNLEHRAELPDRPQEIGSRNLSQVVDAAKTVLRQQKWVVLFVGLLAVATLSLWLWERVGQPIMPGQRHEQTVQTFSGVIWDENGETLGGVEVTLPEFNLNHMTESDGRFSFQVKASQQRHVRLIAQKDGYRTYYGDPTLGYTAMGFTMRREK